MKLVAPLCNFFIVFFLLCKCHDAIKRRRQIQIVESFSHDDYLRSARVILSRFFFILALDLSRQGDVKFNWPRKRLGRYIFLSRKMIEEIMTYQSIYKNVIKKFSLSIFVPKFQVRSIF